MTYTIVNTAGTTVATVNEAEVNSIFDITLIGKNYTNYGQIFNDNMFRLMENFAAPNFNILKPVKGQLWFNTGNNTLNLYNGTSWNSIAGAALTVKGTKVGINNTNPEFDMDITSTLRSKGAAWINYAGANNSDANQAGLVLGTVAKGVLPTNNAGTIGIWSSEGATSRLQGMISLKTDPTVDNRRLAIGVIEQGTGWRNITLAEQGGSVGIGTTLPQVKLHVVNSTNTGTASDNAGILVSSTNRNGYVQADGAYSSSFIHSNAGVIKGRIIYDNATNRITIRTNGDATANDRVLIGVGADTDAHPYRVGIQALGDSTDIGGRLGARQAGDSGRIPWVLQYKSQGTLAAPAAVLAGDTIGGILAIPYDGTAFGGWASHISLHASENWTNTNHGSDIRFFVNKNGQTARNEILRLDQSGSVIVYTNNHTTQALKIASDGNQWVQMHASLDAGDYNPSVLAGDSAIIYSAGTIDTGRLVIAPWGTTQSGIVIDNTGKFGTNTTSVVQFTGTDRGAFTINDINSTTNQWTALEFSNPVRNEIPLARIAMQYTTGGSYLSLGTSQSYASGITNQALTIDPVGRVGIGTNSPAVGYSLTSDGPVYINSQNTDITPTSAWAGQITARGAGYSGGIALDATGLWLGHNSPNRSIVFATDETEKMRVTPAGDVIIGNNTAVSNQLNKELNIYSTGQFNGIVMQNSTTGTGRKGFVIFNNNLDGGIYTWGAGSLYFGTNEQTRMILDANGNVGVGLTPDGSALLDVASNIQAVTPGPIASSSHGAIRIKADATNSQGVLQFVNHAGSAQKAFIRVTSLGEMVLHVDGTSSSDNIIISPTGVYTDGATGNSKGQGTINAKGLYIDGVAVVAGAGAGYTAPYPVSTGETWTYTDPGGQSTYYWGTSDGHAMRPYTTAGLSVAYAANAGNAVNATNATEATRAGTAASAQALNTSNNYQVNSLGIGTTPSGTTGMIRATNDIIAFYSDGRLKDNIQLIVDPLNKLLGLRGVTYTQNKLAEQFGYNDYDSRVGVIAQDVAAVLPEAVCLAPFDTDADGNSISGENYMTVKYDKIVPLLIEAIKELTAKVNELEAKLA